MPRRRDPFREDIERRGVPPQSIRELIGNNIRNAMLDDDGRLVHQRYYGDPLRKLWSERQRELTKGAGALALAGTGAAFGSLAGPPGAIIGGTAGTLIGAGGMAAGRARANREPQDQSWLRRAIRDHSELDSRVAQHGLPGGSGPRRTSQAPGVPAPATGARTAQTQAGMGDMLSLLDLGGQPQDSAYQGVVQGATGPITQAPDPGNPLADAYDQMIAALTGQGDVMRDQAATAQQNIGGFYDYARQVAEGGRAPMAETFDAATANVGGLYDQLAGNLEGMPQQFTDIAQAAGGSGMNVADRVAAAVAPFAAAGETSRANVSANLAQHSTAGQDYLTQLAASTGPEAAMAQTSVEQALQANMADLAFRTAQVEAQKQEALMRASADISGSVAEQAALAALASGAFDIGELAGIPGMDLGTLKQLTDLSNAQATGQLRDFDLVGRELDLQDRFDPISDSGLGRVRDYASTLGQNAPHVMRNVERVLRTVESNHDFGEGTSAQNMVNAALQVINQGDMVWANNPEGRQFRDQVEAAIRLYYGK